MANAKGAKDGASGWAFDFNNPDAGSDAGPKVDPAMVGDDATMQKVIAESLKDGSDNVVVEKSSNKKEEVAKAEPTEEDKEWQENEKKRRRTKRELIKKIEGENEALLEKYLQEGPFVYELYAIMVHSGSAFGGHYYAYIKDIETSQWYNFNDSIVRPINLVDLCETFGPEPMPKQTGVRRNNMARKRLEGARNSSAYMLMYRIVDKTEDRANLNIHEDEIPDEIKEDVEAAEVQTKQAVIIEEKKSQRMQLKVVYRPKGASADFDID